MTRRTLTALRLMPVLCGAAQGAQMSVPAPAAPAALFAPAPAVWGPAFAGVSRWLETPAAGALAARHPFVGALQGLDASRPEALEAVAPMAEVIASANPAFRHHMERVAELPEVQQRQVLAVLAYAHEKGARELEARLDAAIESAKSSGDYEGLVRLSRLAPRYSVYGPAVHQAHVRAFVLGEETARRLRDDRRDGLSDPPGPVAGLESRAREALAPRRALSAPREKGPLLPRTGALPTQESFLNHALLGGLAGAMSWYALTHGETAVGIVLGALTALVVSLGLAGLSRAAPSDGRFDEEEERELRAEEFKRSDQEARRRGRPPEKW